MDDQKTEKLERNEVQAQEIDMDNRNHRKLVNAAEGPPQANFRIGWDSEEDTTPVNQDAFKKVQGRAGTPHVPMEATEESELPSMEAAVESELALKATAEDSEFPPRIPCTDIRQGSTMQDPYRMIPPSSLNSGFANPQAVYMAELEYMRTRSQKKATPEEKAELQESRVSLIQIDALPAEQPVEQATDQVRDQDASNSDDSEDSDGESDATSVNSLEAGLDAIQGQADVVIDPSMLSLGLGNQPTTGPIQRPAGNIKAIVKSYWADIDEETTELVIANLVRIVRTESPRCQFIGVGPLSVETRVDFAVREIRELFERSIRDTHRQIGTSLMKTKVHIQELKNKPDSDYAMDFNDMVKWYVWPAGYTAKEFTPSCEFIGQDARPLSSHEINKKALEILRKKKADRSKEERKWLRANKWITTKGFNRRRGAVYVFTTTTLLSIMCGGIVVDGIKVPMPLVQLFVVLILVTLKTNGSVKKVLSSWPCGLTICLPAVL
jgi:hypothetical protein